MDIKFVFSGSEVLDDDKSSREEIRQKMWARLKILVDDRQKNKELERNCILYHCDLDETKLLIVPRKTPNNLFYSQ